MEPATVKFAAVLRVAPSTERVPAMDEVVLSESEPFEMSRTESLDEIDRLLTESDADEECVTVMPG